jgi:hypothetical protein
MITFLVLTVQIGGNGWVRSINPYADQRYCMYIVIVVVVVVVNLKWRKVQPERNL